MKKRLKNKRLDIEAEEYNDFLEIRRDYKQGRLTNQPGRFDTGNNNQTSGIIRGMEGLRAGSAIGFEPDTAKVVNDRDKLNPVIEFTMVTAEHMTAQTTGVLLGPAQTMGFAQAHTPGRVAFARVNFTDAGHTHAMIADGQTDLVSGAEGDLILAATGDDGNQLGGIIGLANAIVYIVGGDPLGIRFAQAPAGGLPARVGGVLGQAECDVLISAPSAGTSYIEGELVKTGRTITIQNYGSSVVADQGDRIIQHDGTKIVGYDCANSGDPNDFQTLEGA